MSDPHLLPHDDGDVREIDDLRVDPHDIDDFTDDFDDQLTHEQREVAGLSQSQIVRRRFLRHKGAMIGLFVLLFITVLAITSVGAGPIPGWYQWEHTDLVPVQADQGPTMSLRPEFLGGSGISWVPDRSVLDRAREVLEELRRRAAQPNRPRIELEYLDRLMDQF